MTALRRLLVSHRLVAPTVALILCAMSGPSSAWGNHALASYRVFEAMPEVAKAAPVNAEPLEAFLRAEEKAIAKLLAEQEAWLLANVPNYPARPAALAFSAAVSGNPAASSAANSVASPARSDDALRRAFLGAIRVAHDSRFALYYELDAKAPNEGLAFHRHVDVSTLPGLPNAPRRFVVLKPGEQVAALKVLASAAYEPDFGLDINLMDDSPSDWGKTYGFGALPFGNPKLAFSTQSPFHMGFYHEDKILYLAAPFLKRTFPLVRVNQYAGLAALAFKTGHAYWGWRFSGLALHYVQDLSQPYHASLSPGSGTAGLLGTNVLAMAGFPTMKNNTITLLSNRHLALERYQSQILAQATSGGANQALVKSLGNLPADAAYPAWGGLYSLYARDVVAKESYDYAAKLAKIIEESLPGKYVGDPAFDFGASEATVDLIAELAAIDPAKRKKLDDAVAELLTHFGAHSRNTVRGILKAAAVK